MTGLFFFFFVALRSPVNKTTEPETGIGQRETKIGLMLTPLDCRLMVDLLVEHRSHQFDLLKSGSLVVSFHCSWYGLNIRFTNSRSK